MSLPIRVLILVFIALTHSVSYADLHSDVQTVLEEEGLVGVTWALVSDDGNPTLGVAGLRDGPSHIEFSTDTRVHVGSLTKALLATGILRLVTTGDIGLDEPVSRYVPALSFDNPWRNSSEVTVRHLLDHTSGLNDARLWQIFSERPQPDTPLLDAFPASGDLLRIRSRPGTRFSYSNMGYTVLGLVVEAVTGTRYETYLDQHLLAPLGMRDSTFSFTAQEGGHLDPMLSWGHVDDGSRFAASAMFLRPAGQFATTSGDLARFAQFILGDGTIDGAVFIHQAPMRMRGHASGTEAANAGLVAGYALGLGRRDRHGVVGYCHGGNTIGFVAMLCAFPDEGKAFAYSVNTDSETADYGRIDSLLIDALGIADAAPPPTGQPAPDVSDWFGRYILSPNRFESFRYLDTVFGAAHVFENGDFLTLAALQSEPRDLRPVGGRLFSAEDRATVSHVFLRDENGEYLISDGFKTFEKVPAAFLAAHWISMISGLAGLVWLLLAGLLSLVRYRRRFLVQAEAPAFISIMALALPIPLFLNQSFLALGDLTPAGAVLAIVTLLLPVGMCLTIFRSWTMPDRPRSALVHGVAALLALQWCLVVAANGMLPLRLWA